MSWLALPDTLLVPPFLFDPAIAPNTVYAAYALPLGFHCSIDLANLDSPYQVLPLEILGDLRGHWQSFLAERFGVHMGYSRRVRFTAATAPTL